MKMKMRIKKFVGGSIYRFFCMFPINRNKIVFSCFTGTRYGDSPRAIAEEIIRQKLDYDLVWLMKKGIDADFPPEIKKKSASFISQAFHLATAKVWVDSHRKPLYVKKRRVLIVK